MTNAFTDVLNIAGVQGVVYLSDKGTILHKEFRMPQSHGMERMELLAPIQSLAGIREADLIFVNCRIYLRKKPEGFIMVVMDHFVSMAMVRLQCDLLQPSVKAKPKGSTFLKGIFRQRR